MSVNIEDHKSVLLDLISRLGLACLGEDDIVGYSGEDYDAIWGRTVDGKAVDMAREELINYVVNLIKGENNK